MRSFMIVILASIAPLSFAAGAAPANTKNDKALGQLMMLRCQTCHAVKANAPAKVGPNLHNIFGREAGKLSGYTFSPAMRKSGVIWSDATLDKFLDRPSTMMPGTLMAFGGMPKKEERAALILWLKNNTR